MPHVDEMLATVTVAAAGLAVAVALQPLHSSPARTHLPAKAQDSAVASRRTAEPVRLAPIEVIARRADLAPTASHRVGARASKPAA